MANESVKISDTIKSELLNNLKLLLNIEEDDESQDEKLSLIISMSYQRLSILLCGNAVPESLLYIVTEVSAARFNRISSEGMSSNSVEGESITFYEDDFSKYQDEIDSWLSYQEDYEDLNKGRIKFI